MLHVTAVDGGTIISQGRQFFEEAAFYLLRFFVFGDGRKGIEGETQADR